MRGFEGGDGTDQVAKKNAKLDLGAALSRRIDAAEEVLPTSQVAAQQAGEASALPRDVSEDSERQSNQPFGGDPRPDLKAEDMFPKAFSEKGRPKWQEVIK